MDIRVNLSRYDRKQLREIEPLLAVRKLAPIDRVEVRINGALRHEPARVLLELKRRGIARSNMDAIAQGLLALWEKTLDRDAKAARLKALGAEED
jgi:hypothetical protein